MGACDPDSRAVVEEVFGAAPGEGFIGRLLTKRVEEFDCLAVGEDVEEAGHGACSEPLWLKNKFSFYFSFFNF